MTKRFYLDLLERVAWTFVQGFAAEWIVSTSFDRRSLEVGLVAGAASVAKCLLATQVGNRNSASTVPAVTSV